MARVVSVCKPAATSGKEVEVNDLCKTRRGGPLYLGTVESVLKITARTHRGCSEVEESGQVKKGCRTS